MPRLSTALVVDSDPKGLESLGYGFQSDGCRAVTSSDFAAADALADPVEVAVVVVREPRAAALDLLGRLRKKGGSVALLAMGPATVREQVRAAGVDFLPLPAFVRDVLTAGKMLVAERKVAGGANAEADISGSLSDYGLVYLVRTMVGLGRSAIIQVERANRRGEVRVSGGEVTAAQVGSLQSSAAFHHLLLWEEAALEIKLRSQVRRGPINKRPEELIEEAERFLRDFAHATKDLGPTRAVFLADQSKATSAGQDVPVEVGPVVRLFDGQRTLGEVIEDSPFRVFDTLRVVSRLRDLGVLSRKDGVVPEDGASKLPLSEWLSPPPAQAIITVSETPTALQGSEGAPVLPSTPPAPASAPPASAATDQRGGPGTRRKSPRRDHKATLEQATLGRGGSSAAPPAVAVPAAVPAAIPAKPGPLAPAKAAPAHPRAAPAPAMAAAPAPTGRADLSTSGTLEMKPRGPLHAGPSARPAPAVTAETPSIVVDFGADPDPPAQAAPTPPPRPAAPVARVEKHLVQTVGTVEVVATPANGIPRRPLPPPAAPAPPADMSIQIDPALMEDMAAIESAPATPPPIPIAAAPQKRPPSRPRTTPVKSRPTVPEVKRPTGKRPSAEFSALEADFFARESELYKEEKPESFDDLDRKGQRRR